MSCRSWIAGGWLGQGPDYFGPSAYILMQRLKVEQLKLVIFDPEVLPDVCLVEGDDGSGVQHPETFRSLGQSPKAQRVSLHGVDDHPHVALGALRDLLEVRLEDVVAVEVVLLAGRLDPDFFLGVLGEDVETGDVETELAGFGELPEADSATRG